MSISGATRVAGVIGDPVAHSQSPAIFNAAFDACDLDWVYTAFPVAAGRGFDAVRAMATLGIAGLNVTMPHKADAAKACDDLSEDARTLGVVNTCVLRPDGSIFGDATDGRGLLAALADVHAPVRDASVVILGAGGAARSAALALGRAGAFVTIAARRPEVGAAAAALAPNGRAVAWDALPGLLNGFDLVVNATPLGMHGEHAPFMVATVRADTFVYDMVYAPDPTPLIAEARRVERRAANGLGMLVHQAALAFELFTGEPAPLDVMRAAVRTSAS